MKMNQNSAHSKPPNSNTKPHFSNIKNEPCNVIFKRDFAYFGVFHSDRQISKHSNIAQGKHEKQAVICEIDENPNSKSPSQFHRSLKFDYYS